uniref:Uncharacterized protein n=1 Tax=Cacopsylla melanoneura TaxID=428564 RepID=A0A8D8VXU4_9HEMI
MCYSTQDVCPNLYQALHVQDVAVAIYRYRDQRFGPWKDLVFAAKRVERGRLVCLYSVPKLKKERRSSERLSPKHPWSACVVLVQVSRRVQSYRKKLSTMLTKLPLTDTLPSQND